MFVLRTETSWCKWGHHKIMTLLSTPSEWEALMNTFTWEKILHKNSVTTFKALPNNLNFRCGMCVLLELVDASDILCNLASGEFCSHKIHIWIEYIKIHVING